MAPRDDWQPTRPPVTTAEKRYYEKAKKQNADARVKAELEAQKAQREAEKRKLEEWRKAAKERDEKIKAMQPALEQRRTNCRTRLLEMVPLINKRRADWMVIIIDMTKAYSDAYDKFKGIIELQRKEEERMSQIAFGILAAVSVGSLSVLSTVVQNKWIKDEVSQILFNGLEDAIQLGSDKVVSAGAGTDTPQPQPIPQPVNYRGELEKLVLQYEGEVNGWITARGDAIKALPFEYFYEYDENDLAKEIKRYWDNLDKKFKPVKLDTVAFGKEIEIGLWAKWLGSYLIVEDRWVVWKALIGKYRRNVGDPITDRLHELGIVTGGEKNELKMFSDDHPTHIFERLVKWGANWRPGRVFGSVS